MPLQQHLHLLPGIYNTATGIAAHYTWEGSALQSGTSKARAKQCNFQLCNLAAAIYCGFTVSSRRQALWERCITEWHSPAKTKVLVLTLIKDAAPPASRQSKGRNSVLWPSIAQV